MSKPAFKPGDKVAWHHEFSTQHASGSVVRASAVPTFPDDHPFSGQAGSGQFGTVMDIANEEGTYFDVALDNGETITLTADELVRVANE